METLRDLLKQKNPELYSAFQETWKYLENNFLPIMPLNLDKSESLNSLPHLKNNENYLNSILPISENLFIQERILFLTPYELYAILTSIALHDIGRSQGVGKGHGVRSKKMIKDFWEKLRIPNYELTKAIGDICEIHEPEALKKEKNPIIEVELSEKGINKINLVERELVEKNSFAPYPVQMLDNDAGTIRVNELGALLSLVDNMDATYRRLAPLEVMGKSKYNTDIAIIRNYIKAVAYNSESQAIIVSVENQLNLNYRDLDEEDIIKDEKKCLLNIYYWFRDFGFFKISGLDEISKIVNGARLSEIELVNFKGNKKKSLFRMDVPKEKKELLLEFIWQIISGVQIRKIAKFKEDFKITPVIILAIILGNVRSCHRSLINKYKYLSRLGIPIKTWLIYIDEHLYNYYGQETFEPVLTTNYLERVAQKMWELGTRVFGKSFFTYEMLASAINEKDLTLIKLAVKRLEIISRDNDKKPVSAINYNQLGWQWEFMEENNKCIYRSFYDIKEILEKLGNPILKSKPLP
jgi:hypothetical protein